MDQGSRGAEASRKYFRQLAILKRGAPGKVIEPCKKRKEEISQNVTITSTFNALHKLNWPHLWRNDIWIVSSQLTAPLTTSKRVLMGQVFKEFSRNYTNGRLGWNGGNYIRKWPPQKWACNLGKFEREKKTQELIVKRLYLINIWTICPRTCPTRDFMLNLCLLPL